jgi:hypothetical protein
MDCVSVFDNVLDNVLYRVIDRVLDIIFWHVLDIDSINVILFVCDDDLDRDFEK